jgi:hypothetical protein
MRSRAILPLLAVVCALSAVPARAARDGWESYDGGCIGGAKCGSDGWQLRIRLEDETVTAVRFHAHDNVGDRSDGHLRVRLNGQVLDDDIDVPKNGDWFEYPVDRVRGHELLFEAFAHDEVVVEDIEVQYRGGRGDRGDHGGRGGHGGRGDHGGRGGSRGDWQSYEDEDGCIGGSRCEDDEIRIRLEDAPVLAVRFHAHDNVGNKSGGHLQVSIDDEALSDDIDVPKDGDDYELDADRTRGRYLIFEALTDDEVVVEDIEVQYGGRR